MRASVILFPHVELLDVAGPAEVFSKVDGLETEFLSADGKRTLFDNAA